MFKLTLSITFLFLYSFQLSSTHASTNSIYKLCKLTNISTSTLYMCLNPKPRVTKHASTTTKCAKECEDINNNIINTNNPRSTSKMFSYHNISTTFQQHPNYSITIGHINFNYFHQLPFPIFAMTSSDFCFAFDFQKKSQQCGLFIDDGVVRSVNLTSDHEECNLYQVNNTSL